jgi:hypothetical protein
MRRHGHLTSVPVLVVLAAACQDHPASKVLEGFVNAVLSLL